MKRRTKLTPTPPRTSTNDNHEPDSEGEEEASFAPNQIDALVNLQPNVSKGLTPDLEATEDEEINLCNEEQTLVTVDGTETAPENKTAPENNDGTNLQAEETARNLKENPPHYAVRSQRQRQPPLRFGYYAPGNPAMWQDPNIGMVQVGKPETAPGQWMGPGSNPIFPQQANTMFPQQPPWISPISNPMYPQQTMNPVMPLPPLYYGVPPLPFSYYPETLYCY